MLKLEAIITRLPSFWEPLKKKATNNQKKFPTHNGLHHLDLAKLGIQISESRYFDIATYAEIIEIELTHVGGEIIERQLKAISIDFYFKKGGRL